MLNQFFPFPRYEKAIFVGDKATELLSALQIHPVGLIGGEIPSIELYHPFEKLLECTACAMKHKRQILFSAAKKIPADYILLEDNRTTDLNPADMAEELRGMGLAVKVLDVNGTVDENLRRAGEMFGEEKQAERIIKDRETRFELLKGMKVPVGLRVLYLMGIRQRITQETYLFALTENSELSALTAKYFGMVNTATCDGGEVIMPGVMRVNDLSVLLRTNPDAIAVVGDSMTVTTAIQKAVHEDPALSDIDAVRMARIHHLPYWGDPLCWRDAVTLQQWAQVFEEV